MKHLLHTIVVSAKDRSLIKYEIYSNEYRFDYYGKVPEGTCRVIAYKLEPTDSVFKVTDSDLSLDELFKANQPKPNAWYSDGPHRVNLEMVIEYLKHFE